MSWSNDNKPFLLSPAAKDYLWGGTRLNDDFNLSIPLFPLAEAWVCSSHPDGESTVSGQPMSRVLEEHLEWLGSLVLAITEGRAELPILIKLIDAKRDLSVQVHPDDEYAAKVEGQWGKTEMWYVLAAKPCAELVYGFNRDVTPDQIRETIENGTIGSLLNHVQRRDLPDRCLLKLWTMKTPCLI